MNKELKIFNNSAIVVDEKKQEKKLTLTDNLEEILTAENNIEYIQNQLEKIDFECKHTISNNKLIKIITAIGLIAIFGTCSALGANNIIALWTMPFLLATTFGFSAFVLNINNKYKKQLKTQENILKESFIEESQKIKELEKNSKKINIQENQIKNIKTSECIKNLKRKLRIIRNYEKEKSFYMNLYSNYQLGEALFEMGYNIEELNLVVSLIQNDLENKQERKNKKTLIKK